METLLFKQVLVRYSLKPVMHMTSATHAVTARSFGGGHLTPSTLLSGRWLHRGRGEYPKSPRRCLRRDYPVTTAKISVSAYILNTRRDWRPGRRNSLVSCNFPIQDAVWKLAPGIRRAMRPDRRVGVDFTPYIINGMTGKKFSTKRCIQRELSLGKLCLYSIPLLSQRKKMIIILRQGMCLCILLMQFNYCSKKISFP
ncbi:hypothetical protein ElyMa_000044800 [Elysia marginata]|uniref:Uncharacterized protein n=1 Tax=Elysia marginata TaxID=1093978 RepID=A0AAV4ED55_9GAST|nr:hypothetical protein ElyMa_000044800 [Elysia marginata]